MFSAQSGCCTFVPRRPNKSLKIDHVELSYCQKNRWDNGCAQFWFYAKVGFPNSENPTEVSYPLASRVAPVEHISQADFRRSGVGYKDCLDAFASAAGLIGGRDLIEMFICANIWPLSTIRASKETVSFPKLALVKPLAKVTRLLLQRLRKGRRS